MQTGIPHNIGIPVCTFIIQNTPLIYHLQEHENDRKRKNGTSDAV
jgi:hypothetical protein